eukprot:SAG31_NODE_356_length_17180_cov_7.595925_14_plen_117_part_00
MESLTSSVGQIPRMVGQSTNLVPSECRGLHQYNCYSVAKCHIVHAAVPRIQAAKSVLHVLFVPTAEHKKLFVADGCTITHHENIRRLPFLPLIIRELQAPTSIPGPTVVPLAPMVP